MPGFREPTKTSYGWAETLNRTSVKVGTGTEVPTTYDAANRPLDQAGVANAFDSDPDGRMIQRPTATGAGFQRFTWDHLGRVTSVKRVYQDGGWSSWSTRYRCY